MKRSLMTIIAAVAAIANTLTAYGTTNYWDNNGSDAGFGAAGGTWGVSANWSVDSTGVSVPAVTNTTTTDLVNFGTATDGLAAGTIMVDSTNQAFRTMTFGAASGSITLSGGAFKLAEPSSAIIVNNSSNVVDSVLAGTNALQVVFPKKSMLIYPSYLTTSPVVIFTGATLADYISAGGIMGGGYVTGGTAPATVYYFVNNGSIATYQLQAYNGGYTKCVKVVLTQSGADIAARADYAKYVDGYQLGFNFEEGGTGGTVATALLSNGYGVAVTELIAPFALSLTRSNTYSGSTTISNGILRLDGNGQLGSGSYTGNIVNAGVLLYNSDSNQVLRGNISGSGSLQKNAASKILASLTYSAFLPPTPATATIFPKTRLADCVAADGYLGGSSITGGRTSGDAFFFTNNGTVATWQLQTTNDVPWTKCVKIQLTQSGNDVTACVLYAKHINNSGVLGYNFDNGGINDSIATSAGVANYGAAETTLTFYRYPKLTISGANSYTGGTLVNVGTLEVSGTTASLPTTGGITVNSGGELRLSVPGDPGTSGSVGGNNPIFVNGGTLTINGMFNAGHSRPIAVDGGVINSTISANDDNSNYMNNLTLMNGASIIGYKIRVGYVSTPKITVIGTNACSISAGINMVKNGETPLTFSVADVTGNSAADLIISGVIRDYTGAAYQNMPIIKTGAGTLSLSGANTHIGIININAGTLALERNGSLNTGNPVVLNGGALNMGGFTNSVGTLTLSSNSTVILGSGTIAFANSSAKTWSGTLTLTGTLAEKSVRVGTDNTALTLGQLNAIFYNGGAKVRLDKDGYLTTNSPGTLILIM